MAGYCGGVTDQRDDDALSWGGDDDPTLDVGAPRHAAQKPPTGLPDGYTAVGRGSERLTPDATPAHDDADGGAPHGVGLQVSNAALVAYGIVGGIYLLFTIGWVVGGLRLQTVAPALLVSPAAYVPFFWLAVLAPAIWFGATMLLTRTSAVWLRFVWLVAGIVLLVPWPFIMIGAVGL